MNRIIVVAATLLAGCQAARVAPVTQIAESPPSYGEVSIEPYNGMNLVRVQINNGLSFRCMIDTGAYSLAIPARLVERAIEDGSISESNMRLIGDVSLDIAGGGQGQGIEIKLGEIEMGSVVVRDVVTTVIPDGTCLVGRSIFDRFGSVTIDNNRNVLRFS